MSLADRILKESAPEYSDFLAQQRDDVSVGVEVLLYGPASLPERNQTFEVEEYLPGWFTLGDNSGGRQFLMKLDGNPAVYACDAGALGSLDPDLVAPKFAEWLAGGCPMPQARRSKLPFMGDLWMTQAPPNGLKDLLKLKQTLALQLSMGQLKEHLQALPCRIATNIPCNNWDGRLEKLPDMRDCFAFTPIGGQPG